MMTAYGTTETAIEATKLGAFDYILKPFDIPDMLIVITKALEAGRFMRSPVDMNVPPDKAFREAIIGRSNPMQEVYKAIGRVAPTDATVLIRGDSGTGKELVARAIYQHSLRAGNVRELANTIQKALIFNRGAPLSVEDIDQAIREKSPINSGHKESRDHMLRQLVRRELTAKTGKNLFDVCMDHFASIIISEALNFTGGNRSQAAKLLGLSRPTLHSKIEKYRLKFKTSVKEDLH